MMRWALTASRLLRRGQKDDSEDSTKETVFFLQECPERKVRSTHKQKRPDL